MFSDSDSKEAIKRLEHILGFIEKARVFLDGKTPDDLHEEEVLSLAMEKLLQNIGEAANCVSEDIRDYHPNIPWRKMIDMRNKLAHGYDDIDNSVIWSTSVNDLRTVEPDIQKILEALKDGK